MCDSLSERKLTYPCKRKRRQSRIRLNKATESQDDEMGSMKQVNNKVGMHTCTRPELGNTKPRSREGCIFPRIWFCPCISHKQRWWMRSSLHLEFP
jgi:hypothetical protein